MSRFEENTGLVYSTFNREFASFRYIEEDLIQEGLLGLWKACRTYKESSGVKFSTYAVVCIRNNMNMYVNKELRHKDVLSTDYVKDTEDCVCSRDKLVDKTYCTKLETSIEVDAVMEEAVKFGMEKEVKLKLAGYKNREIAEELGVSAMTISNRFKSLYRTIKENFLKK